MFDHVDTLFTIRIIIIVLFDWYLILIKLHLIPVLAEEIS